MYLKKMENTFENLTGFAVGAELDFRDIMVFVKLELLFLFSYWSTCLQIECKK